MIFAFGVVEAVPDGMKNTIIGGFSRAIDDDSGRGLLGGSSAQQRLIFVTKSFEMIRAAPIVGSGLGSFGYMLDAMSDIYPHNLELELLVAGGCLGFCLFMVFLLPLAANVTRSLFSKTASWERVAVAGMLISTLIRHQFSFSITTGKLLFFSLGCAGAWAAVKRVRKFKGVGRA
jgi:O-antigen ligase